MTSRFAILMTVCASVACGSSPTGSVNQPPPPPANPNVATVTVSDNSYSPSSVTVTAGMSVRWSNGGLAAHTTTGDGGAWDSGTMAGATTDANGYQTGGGNYQRTFSNVGTFPYRCTIHGASMSGTIVVTP